MHFSFADLTGTVGVTLLLVAFGLNLGNKISQNSLLYILLNCIGASLACLASVLIRYVPFVILEAVWTIVSVAALVNYFRKG
ncbi:MAG: hypothetical protein ABI741_00515 [Ferruginibacter sp.]